MEIGQLVTVEFTPGHGFLRFTVNRQSESKPTSFNLYDAPQDSKGPLTINEVAVKNEDLVGKLYKMSGPITVKFHPVTEEYGKVYSAEFTNLELPPKTQTSKDQPVHRSDPKFNPPTGVPLDAPKPERDVPSAPRSASTAQHDKPSTKPLDHPLSPTPSQPNLPSGTPPNATPHTTPKKH